MPLDTGGVANFGLSAEGQRQANRRAAPIPDIDTGPDIGAALKAVREFRSLDLQQLADTTRIRRAYLSAIEEMRLEELPSRPFTIGYIRAYAVALGLDGDEAVERFRREEPVPDTRLRAPIGVQVWSTTCNSEPSRLPSRSVLVSSRLRRVVSSRERTSPRR